MYVRNDEHLGPFQTSHFTCAESNADRRDQQRLLISIKSGTGETRSLAFKIIRLRYTNEFQQIEISLASPYLILYYGWVFTKMVGSLRNNDGEGYENVT